MNLFSDVLLTVDYDRTLTAPDSTVPKRNVEAIEYFMENGGVFTVNTGRSVPMATQLIQRVPVNAPLLLYNGSANYDTVSGELSDCRPINLNPYQVICDLSAHFPELILELQGIDAHYIFQKNPGWEAYCENNNCPWGYADAAQIPLPFLKLALYGEFRKNTVAGMFEATPDELALFAKVEKYVAETYGNAVDFFRPCARIVDIHAKGCSKLNAARNLQKSLGRKILVCAGDAENDISMLDGADYAFCPSDAAIANRYETVCTCSQGAIADIIYRKIPEIIGNQP